MTKGHTAPATRLNHTAHNFYYMHRDCANDANTNGATPVKVLVKPDTIICRFCGNAIK